MKENVSENGTLDLILEEALVVVEIVIQGLLFVRILEETNELLS